MKLRKEIKPNQNGRNFCCFYIIKPGEVPDLDIVCGKPVPRVWSEEEQCYNPGECPDHPKSEDEN